MAEIDRRKQQLINFLKKYNCFIRFIENFKKGVSYRKEWGKPLKLEGFFNNSYLYYTIFDYSFSWSKTKEGYVFWNKICDIWKKILKYGQYNWH